MWSWQRCCSLAPLWPSPGFLHLTWLSGCCNKTSVRATRHLPLALWGDLTPCTGYCPPTQLHTAYGGTPSNLTFSWYTTLPTLEPRVGIEHEDGHTEWFNASMVTYLPSAGWFYNATVSGITPEAEFHYVVGSEANGYSDSHHFYGPPTAGNRERTTTIASYGDMGIFQYAMATVQAISKLAENNFIDFVLHAGDYGYGDDRRYAFAF